MTRGHGDTGTRSALCPEPRVRGGKPQGSKVPHQNLRFDEGLLMGTSSPHHIGGGVRLPLSASGASLLDLILVIATVEHLFSTLLVQMYFTVLHENEICCIIFL